MSDIGDELTTRLGEAVEAATHPQTVPVNVYETDEALVVVGALPGVMADDIEVAVEPGRLTITAACLSRSMDGTSSARTGRTRESISPRCPWPWSAA